MVLVGHTSVGKTCVVRKATTGSFTEDSVPTLGASYVSKLVSVGSTDVRLQIWDTAGQERYKGMTPMYYRGAHVALLVYSVTEQESFDAIDSWLQSLQDSADPNIILFLIGNKCDLENERVIDTETGREKASKINANFYEVSAKTGNGIDELFQDIPKIYLEAEEGSSKKKGGSNGVDIGSGSPGSEKKSCCK